MRQRPCSSNAASRHLWKVSFEPPNAAWSGELLIGHDGRFHNELRLNKHIFRRLISVLTRDAGLRATQHVSAEEQLVIFLHYAHRGLSNRALQERFQRSADCNKV